MFESITKHYRFSFLKESIFFFKLLLFIFEKDNVFVTARKTESSDLKRQLGASMKFKNTNLLVHFSQRFKWKVFWPGKIFFPGQRNFSSLFDNFCIARTKSRPRNEIQSLQKDDQTFQNH